MKIDSVRRAVILLGNNRMRCWLRMIVLSDLASPEKPQELLLLALNRGRLREGLSLFKKMREIEPENMFLVDMLSLTDVMLDLPFGKILKNLALPDTLKEGCTNPQSLMTGYLQLATALEQGNNKEFIRLCTRLDLAKSSVAEASLKSGEWTRNIAHSRR